METLIDIFERVGFKAKFTNSETAGQAIQYINNTDGTVRWAWPMSVKEPLFLNFYNQSTSRGKLFSMFIKLVFFFRLQAKVFKSARVQLIATDKSLIHSEDQWALFTGTTGPNRKVIIYIKNKNHDSYIKVALGQNADNLLRNETGALSQLNAQTTVSFDCPQIISSGHDSLRLSSIAGSKQRTSAFNELHKNALQEISDNTSTLKKLSQLDCWQFAINDLEVLKQSGDPRLPKGMLRKLSTMIDSIDAEQKICTSFSHGDFTSWNMYVNSDKLSIYDWELAKPLMPIGFDAFHYIIQQGILVNRDSWKTIENEINTKVIEGTLLELSHFATNNAKLYLKLYLIINTVYYLKLYAQQVQWHMQVSWLLNTWNEGLSSCLAKESSHRELIITDLFDFLSAKSYAALKFQNILPEKLSEYSDIDLCIEKDAVPELNKYLAAHTMVKHVKRIQKTFMCTLQLFMVDGGMLSLDLIWQIKRKSLVMMDIKELLSHSQANEFGVKMPRLIDNVRFIGMFYAMNNTKVPGNYQAYVEVLSQETGLLDTYLHAYYMDGSNAAEIVNIVKQDKQNKGFHAAANGWRYLKDSIRSVGLGRGMVITFSGVDGAGKSTIIENVKYNLDKKYRKKVIVIRHRPSVLPILSVWTKGKEAAALEASSGLPRQGNNTSLASSLFRFAYYYTDYLFGQFYVYFKYVMRGYIVLYDRYYFDFINDSRRSNIQLPAFITRIGYKLLLKPDLNFFLYADASLILTRKKELDAATIQELTHKYLTLFEELNHNTTTQRYVSIENIELKDTLQNILNRMITKAA